MCLKNFLSDRYQHKCRMIAQMQSVKHEDAILRYKKIFLQELNEIKTFDCEKSSGICCDILDKEVCIHEKLKIIFTCEDEIAKIFDNIYDIYIKWINSDSNKSYQMLEQLLETYELLPSNYDIKDHIMYRGRISSNIVTPYDLFHIPFDKRYLITNQRYSLNGQPLLYLGFSVYGVLNEIGCTDITDMVCSTYVTNSSFVVYDFRNQFAEYCKYFYSNLITNTDQTLNSDADIKKALYRLILISCCSFQKRSDYKGYTFTEEYVLPQLIAQVLKQKKYKGVLYNSTIVDLDDESNNFSTLYKSNVAIFTEYNNEHVYDRDLLGKFTISNPLRVMNVFEDLNIDSLIELADKMKMKMGRDRDSDITNIPMYMKNEFGHIIINNQKYFDSIMGKFNLNLSYLYLYDLYNTIK